MDPNETLAEIRRITKLVEDNNLTDIEVAIYFGQLAAHIDALDEWLSRGGFPPSDWQNI